MLWQKCNTNSSWVSQRWYALWTSTLLGEVKHEAAFGEGN